MSQTNTPSSLPWYYRPLFWLLTGVASLPLTVLYALAYGLYLLLAYGVRYRWKVISGNLRNAFPEKSEAEVTRLGKDFYWHFAQVIVEILKLLTISKAELYERAKIRNFELAEKAMELGHTVLVLGSHAGNWEWILSTGALYYPDRAHGVYKPLSNGFFEYFMKRLRTRSGAYLVPMRDTLRDMVRYRNQARCLALLTDQAAGPEDQPYWTDFLHQDTGFYTSADRLAPRFQCPVVYVGIRRVRRGYYDITLTEIYDGITPISDKEHFITEAFARQLERDIQAAPAEYLWSHRRWKHKRVTERLSD
ncbi:lysophospholipid acyltransferase family protein [Hymenobacter sp. GOD-10R]|uniref:lysophospholipid acyltransferase family protein n=1 Tax=Hymenobacter sp. GOD-10R TaxID=3093922 RepID=UPI002D793761|nr:lysophospholipid acyltransferase family protein [Hymenobacter sp. GOD-10R]WRQ27354.1 lysophospholipid acyltransferase family protein [Hymenobacter sp. GOD-10R]